MVAGTQDNAPLNQERGTEDSILGLGQCRLATGIHQTSEVLRDAGRRIGENGGTPVSRATEHAADSLEQAANYVQDTDPRTMMSDINRFARRQPELFLGGALLAGVLLGRFLRSEPERPDEPGHKADRDAGLQDTAEPQEMPNAD